MSQGSQPLSVTAYSAWRCLISDLELSTEHLRKHSISNAMTNVSVSSELFCIINDLSGHIWSKFMFLPHVGPSETIMQQGAPFFSPNFYVSRPNQLILNTIKLQSNREFRFSIIYFRPQKSSYLMVRHLFWLLSLKRSTKPFLTQQSV